MTLVITDVSRHGIVMVGDSAVTAVDVATGKPKNTIPGAAKVHYSPGLNLGIAVWGCGHIGVTPVDKWVCDTLTNLDTRENLQSVGEWIVRELNAIRYQEGRAGEPWTWGGFHLAGYLGGVPRLWHIHNGHLGEPVREFRLHRDFPDAQGWSDEEFLQGLEQGWWIHLRNGYIRAFVRHYNILRVGMPGSSGRSWETSDTRLAGDDLASRMNFYKMVIRRVADALKKEGIHAGVNNELSAVAFTGMGPVLDELLPVRSGELRCPVGHMLGF